jgi:N-acetylglucosaminyldiphosphoundecaprenol N-acetyl-beta-D-mannosaminyltransferase
VCRVGDVDFAVSTPGRVSDWVLEQVELGTAVDIRFSNAYCVALARRDFNYRSVFQGGVSFADGAPVVGVLRLRGHVGALRARGPSMFRRILADSVGRPGVSHFFLGSSDDTLADLTNRISVEYPGLVVAGSFSPPFRDVSPQDIEDWARMIGDSGASIVWVSLGTPKQDFVARELSRACGLPVLAVGAAFDFVAGTVQEAPTVVQRLGFEWAFRLLSEPRRLWRRYLFGNAAFLRIVAPEVVQGLVRRRYE